MSVIVETPIRLQNEEPLTTSFYIPIEEDDSTVFSNHAPNANEMNIFSKKRYSEGYRSLMKSKKRLGKSALFEYFTTKNILGYPIRNARTGYLYPQYRVGRYHEYLFFKVRLSTEDSYQAQQNQNMFNKIKINHEKPDLDVLFYDSPEEYENHQNQTLSPEIKHQWRLRYEKLIRFMEKNTRNENNSTNLPPGLSVSTTVAAVAVDSNGSLSPNYPPPNYYPTHL